jgi:hypothetical protein
MARLALPPSDPTLTAPKVISTFLLSSKKIEQAGKGYAKLQSERKFGKLEEERKLTE